MSYTDRILGRIDCILGRTDRILNRNRILTPHIILSMVWLPHTHMWLHGSHFETLVDTLVLLLCKISASKAHCKVLNLIHLQIELSLLELKPSFSDFHFAFYNLQNYFFSFNLFASISSSSFKSNIFYLL
jgi:hypothetical protein